MSRRHQSSRRKAYGRRQHEVRERQDRRHAPDALDLEDDVWGAGGRTDPLGFDPRLPRLHYAAE
jgi:hypothetical protein